MSVIYSTKGTEIQVDKDDFDQLHRHVWSEIQTAPQCFYFTSTIEGKTEYLHRKVIGNPEKLIVDHRDGNTLDCRKSNLRSVTPSQSQMNRAVQSNSKTGVKGVFPNGDKYRSYIRVRGKQIWLGSFDTAEKAKEAYDKAASHYFGEFVRS